MKALSTTDFISLHVPLLREVRVRRRPYHLINETTLRTMKPTANGHQYFAGSGNRRGGSGALPFARTGLAGAALDVYEKEPLPTDSPLRDPAIADRLSPAATLASAGRITRLSSDPNKGMAGRCVQGLIDVWRELRRRHYEDCHLW